MSATVELTERDVRAVIGVPLRNGVERGHIQEALDSLLAQTYPFVAFVFVDDGSTDKTLEVVASVAARATRGVHVASNTPRLGLVRNWRRVFERATELYPNAIYFAWGSDHDLWHSRWLETLVAELDANPKAVMAYPRHMRIDERGQEIAGPSPRSFRKSAPLLRRWSKIGAGSLVYGLYRSEMLRRVGVYPLVYRPDVYIMLELSLYGELRMVSETLWYRRERYSMPGARRSTSSNRARSEVGLRVLAWLERMGRVVGIGPVGRQHRHIFPDGVPLYSRLPSSVQHASLLFWRLAVLGRGRPHVGRRAGSRYAATLLFEQ